MQAAQMRLYNAAQKAPRRESALAHFHFTSPGNVALASWKTGSACSPLTFTFDMRVQPPPLVGRPLPSTKAGICASGNSCPPNSSLGYSRISSLSPYDECHWLNAE